MRRYLLDKSRCSALNTFKEDHAYLPDKYDALSHTTSQKLAARAAELTVHERQVEPSPPSYTMRMKQRYSTAPRLSTCNPHSMLTMPCRQISHGTMLKKQLGP